MIPDNKLTVVNFPNNSLADVPQKLRDLADLIEEKHFGEAEACVVVLHTDVQFSVFGLGCEVDGTTAHYLLACAQAKIQEPMLVKGNV